MAVDVHGHERMLKDLRLLNEKYAKPVDQYRLGTKSTHG
jgi:hypothetical protein